MAEAEPTTDEMVKLYAKAITFGLGHRLLCLAASLSLGFWFLCPLLFPEDFSGWVLFVVIVPNAAWYTILYLKLGRVAKNLITLHSVRFERWWYTYPLKYTRCVVPALRPSESDSAKSPLLWAVYYLSLYFPFLCIFLLLSISFIKFWQQY